METPLLTIDYRNFILGESAADRTPDRGFSPRSYGLNLTKERGTLYFTESETDRGSTTLVNDIIASNVDPSFLGNDSYHLDAGGNFYTLDGSTFTKRQTDAVKTYAIGTSDLITYNGSNTFATSQTDVALLTGSDLGTIDHDWWTTTRGHSALASSYRHPMEVVEDTLYIADENRIHTWDGSTSVEAAMTLPTGVNITSLRRHPDGRNLIAFCGVTANFSHTRNGEGMAYIIDTVTLEFIREIELDTQIEGSKNVGGVIYVTYGTNLGYFNGDGVVWLRTLRSATTYSHNLGSMEDILIVRDEADVLGYGDLGGGKVWWKMYHGAGTLTNITYKGDNKLLVAYRNTTPKLAEIDYDNAGIGGVFFSNRSPVGANIAIRRIEIDHTETPASGTNSFTVNLYDQVNTVKYTSSPSYVNNPQSMTRLDLDAFLTDLQLNINASQGGIGIRQIRVYGESIE